MGGKVKKERLLDGTKNYCYQISYVAILLGALPGCVGLRCATVLYREEQAVKELNPLHPGRGFAIY